LGIIGQKVVKRLKIFSQPRDSNIFSNKNFILKHE
jgi:hypothetical protein